MDHSVTHLGPGWVVGPRAAVGGVALLAVMADLRIRACPPSRRMISGPQDALRAGFSSNNASPCALFLRHHPRSTALFLRDATVVTVLAMFLRGLRDATAVTVTFLRGAMMMSFLVTVTFLRGAMMMSFLLLRRSCCGRRLLVFPAMPPLMRLPARPPRTRKQGSRQAQKMLYLNHMGIHASRPPVPCLAPPSINPCRNPCLVVWVGVWLKTFLDLSCRNTMVGVGCTNHNQ